MGVVNIALTGIDPLAPTPGTFAEFRVAQGEAVGDSGVKNVLIFAPKTSAGGATPDTQILGPYSKEGDLITDTGAGSPAHRMGARFMKISKGGQGFNLYVICPTVSAGTAAVDKVALTGAITAAGVFTVVFCGVSMSYAYTTSDTLTTIQAAMALAFNAHTELPATYGAAVGVGTITGKIAGTELNSCRFRASVTSGTGLTITAPVTADTAFGASAQVGAAIGATPITYTAALTTILARKFDYILAHSQEATSQIASLVTQMTAQALPATGFLQQAIFGTALTVAAATTLASGASCNVFPLQCVQQKESPEEHYMLAAGMGAVRCVYEISDPSYNYNSFGTKSGQINPFVRPYNDSALPTSTEIDTMLRNGVTPIGVADNGTAYVVRSITTRCKDGGGNYDYRARNTNIVTTGFRFTNDGKAKLALSGYAKITDDPPSTTEKQPDPTFATPKRIKALMETLVRDYADNGWIDPAKKATILSAMIVGINSQNAGRMDVQIPLYSAVWLNSNALLVLESSPTL